ncbi:Conserved_hypothetical protein [Hexamita inflata]|uniref:Uncharacterized protein n=1 Tax=Hexamita inflata TaxID=28002 RepID=A0AA86Q561_9EUKA|nr:Conserved hypothetical protein [Hexamita inflata]CAI9974550.1 Conserved hypothetical protein [Hexamita inflata]
MLYFIIYCILQYYFIIPLQTLSNSLPVIQQRIKKFPHPSRFTYVHKDMDPLESQPMIIDILEPSSEIYREYIPRYMELYRLFPHVLHLFASVAPERDIENFYAKYPQLVNKFDTISLNKIIQQVFQTKIFPYSCVVDENLSVVFEGQITPQLYNVLSKLDLKAKKCSKQITIKPAWQTLQASNRDISLLLSGLKFRSKSTIVSVPVVPQISPSNQVQININHQNRVQGSKLSPSHSNYNQTSNSQIQISPSMSNSQMSLSTRQNQPLNAPNQPLNSNPTRATLLPSSLSPHSLYNMSKSTISPPILHQTYIHRTLSNPIFDPVSKQSMRKTSKLNIFRSSRPLNKLMKNEGFERDPGTENFGFGRPKKNGKINEEMMDSIVAYVQNK